MPPLDAKEGVGDASSVRQEEILLRKRLKVDLAQGHNSDNFNFQHI